MNEPHLRVKLALEDALQFADGLGGFQRRWQRLGWLWAEMDSGTGRERDGGVGSESVVRWRVIVRGAKPGDPHRPKPGQRFRHGSRLFRIEAVAERDPAGRWLVCHVREEFQA